MKFRFKFFILPILLCLLNGSDYSAGVVGGTINNYNQLLKSPNNNWLTYAGDYKANRFSPLTQINSQNISHLAPKWVHSLNGSRDLRVTPIVNDGVMYVTNVNEMHALDAATGERMWFWTINDGPRSGLNRGVGIFGDKIFFVTEDCLLVALNRHTGKLLWQKKYADEKEGYYATLAPLVLRDKVIVGVSGSDNGIRGFLAAFSVEDGEEMWRFWTVPNRSGASTWLNGSYDPDSNIIYWPTGNPWPNFDKSSRPGDNLYSNSMLAIDAANGKLKWYFQFTPGDAHGWDGAAFPVLVDMNWRGQPRKLLLQANRNGFFYVLDRVTGKFLFGKPFVKKINWARGLNENGRPIIVPDRESYDAKGGRTICPWLRGATNWWSTSYSIQTELFYVVALEQCGGERGEFYIRAINPQNGEVVWEHAMPGPNNMSAGVVTTAGGLVFAGDDSGHLVAFDAKTGERVWRFSMGRTISASPMTYAIDGRQYIAIAAGSDIFNFGLFKD